MRSAIALMLLVASCGGSGGDCPADDEIEAIHAAAFYFENEQPHAARSLLDSVRGSSHETSRTLIGKLTAISELIDRDAEQARIETASVRALLGDWRCLRPELHERLHRELPAPR